MHINLSQLISPEVLKQQQQQITAEILKAYGVTGNGYDTTGLLDSFGGPGNSAIGTAAIRDIEQMRGWNFTAILAKSLQIAIGNAAVYCPEWIAQAIADQNGEEYKASKRVTGTEQYGVPEGWVTAPLQHRIAALFQSPNEFTDQATFLFQLAEQTDLHGVASILVLPDGRGLPREMWVIPKAAIQPVGPSHKFPEGSYRVGNLSKLSISIASEEQPKSLQQALARLSRREYSGRYVIQVGLPSPIFMDDFLNQSSAMADVIDTDTQIHRSRRNMLEKIMTNGPRLEPMEGITIQNDEWNKIIDEFVANNTGPANGGSPWRTPPGVKVINDGQTGRELELAKSADQSRDHTLGMRLMNSSMLGLGSGGSYAQVVGLIKGNTRLVLQPLMRIFSGQITIGLKRFFEEPQNQFMVVLQAASIDDPEQRMKEWGFLKEAGVVKKGEVREAFNMMPFEDEAENEKIAGAQEQPGGAADPFGGFGGGSDTSQEYDYGDDYATDSGEPEAPGIGMPETSEDRPEMITTGLVKGTEVEQPQLGKLSRREFLRHQKNIFDVLNKLTSGQMNAKAAVLLLETLGLSKQQAQEFVSTVEESKDTVSMAGTGTVPETPSAADATGGTASALFARMAQLKAGFGKSLIDDAAKTAATHPDNDLKMPSEKELKAGLYRKGKVRLCGLQIEIENPVGSIRSGKRPDGTRWAVEMLDHYGYIVGATGYDKDQLDVFVKNDTEPDFDGDVYVINQSNADGEFDEHKCFIGCESKAEAIVRYLDNYSDNWADRIMSVATLSVPEFKVWMFDSIGGPIAGELTPEMAGRYQLVSASAMTIKAVKDPRDGDGDGKWFDGTPQEQQATFPDRLSRDQSAEMIAKIRAGDDRSKNKGEIRTEDVKTPHTKVSVALSDIPPDVVELLETSTDKRRVDAYARQTIDTPVILFKRRKTKDWGVSDGGHRILAAIKRGDAHIDAYVPDESAKSQSGGFSKSADCNIADATFFRATDPRDGDGDGKIFDSTPQERPAEKPQEDTQRVMFEAAPDPNDVTLTERWRNLSSEDRLAISRKLVDAIMPDVAEQIGVQMGVSEQLGGYLDDTNPSFAAEFDSDIEPEKFIQIMKTAGFALSQDSMMGISTKQIKGSDPVGFVTVQLDAGQDVHEMYMKIRAMDSSVQGHTTIGNQMLIVDFTGRSAEIAQGIQDELDVKTSYNSGFAVFVSKDQYGYDQSTTENQGGATSRERSTDLASRRWGNNLRRKASAIIDRELKTVESRSGQVAKSTGLHAAFFRAISQDTLRQAAQRYQAADDEQPDDPQQQAELIAEILTGLYGDSAIRLIADGDDMEKMASVFKSFTDAITTKAARTRKPGQDPRDADGDGVIFDGTPQERPANRRQPEVAQSQPKQVAQPQQAAQKPTRGKNTPEQVQKIHAAIENALRGERTPKSAKALADQLSTLTVKQLTDLKKKYGISASGKVKKELVDKIAKRLDSGRRTPQVKTPEAKTPEPKKPQTPKPPEAKKPTSLNDDVDAVIKSGDKKAQIEKLKSLRSIAKDMVGKLNDKTPPEVIQEVNRSIAALRGQTWKLRTSISRDGEKLHNDAMIDATSSDTEVLKVARDKLREASRRFDMAGDSETSDEMNQKANAINSKIANRAVESASKRQRAAKTPESAVKITGNVGEAFKSKVMTALAKLPKAIRDIISDTDVDIQIGSQLTDMRPDLAGVRPRGWAATDTWDMVEACARENVAWVAEKHISRYSGELIDNKRVEGAMYHEIGHAIDHEIGIKNNSEFAAAYANDVQTFDTNDKKDLTYFIQEGDAGRSEVAAEGIAILAGRGSAKDPNDDEIFKKKFPQSMRVITNMLNKRARTARRA